jgi:ubiquinone/menaquinone biosynthesis C-methylase UbiE
MANPFTNASQYRPFDNFEAHAGLYRFSSGKLIRAMAPLAERRAAKLVYDAGCGTGNSTLQALKAFPKAHVVGVDSSKDMLRYARVKFGLEPSEGLVGELMGGADIRLGDTKLAVFLMGFVREASPFAKRVGLVEADLMKFKGEPADAVVGSHILHWLEPQEDAAGRFAEMVRPGGCIGFSSSMSFYVPVKHRVETSSYLYHPFTMHYLDILSGLIEKETGKAVHAPAPKEKKNPHETIALFESNGFKAVGYLEVPLPKLSPEMLLAYNLRAVPAHLGMFKESGLPDDAQARLITEAIQETLRLHMGLLPLEGVLSDTNPMFIFRRK